MLDFLGFIITSALMVFAVNAAITFMDGSPSAKLILAALERHLLRQQSRRIFRLVDLPWWRSVLGLLRYVLSDGKTRESNDCSQQGYKNCLIHG